MHIHVVRPGESVYTIARQYRVPAGRIVTDNGLVSPDHLVVGQSLVITGGTSRHRVAAGETLYSIARSYGVSVSELRAANPSLSGTSQVYPGEILVIPPGSTVLGVIEVNGYATPSIKMGVLEKTMPNLTYLSIFHYPVNANGSLEEINDTALIQAARKAHVAPLMVISNREFSSDVAHSVLTNPAIQDQLIRNVTQILRSKHYYGLNIDFEYVYPADRDAYDSFIKKVTTTLKPLGFSVSSALAPKTSANQPGVVYEAHDYGAHGALMDFVVLMTYEWGYIAGPPMPVAPLNSVRTVLDYAVTAIPPRKILMGIPNYGYDWTLPYVKGSTADTISNTEAVEIAYRVKAAIQYDAVAQTPFFTYFDSRRKEHIVWFEDARSINAKLRLANYFKLRGVSYWTIANYFPQNWVLIQSLFRVRKVI